VINYILKYGNLDPAGRYLRRYLLSYFVRSFEILLIQRAYSDVAERKHSDNMYIEARCLRKFHHSLKITPQSGIGWNPTSPRYLTVQKAVSGKQISSLESYLSVFVSSANPNDDPKSVHVNNACENAPSSVIVVNACQS
jgi:hypothetical protein